MDLLLKKKKLYNSVRCLVIKHYHDAFYFEQTGDCIIFRAKILIEHGVLSVLVIIVTKKT